MSKPSLTLKLRALGWALNLTRLNIILLIITSILLSVAQGQDLLLSMLDGKPFGDLSAFLKRLSLYGSTTLWAISIWLWARVLLQIHYKDAPVSDDLLSFYRNHLPRVLGVLAFVAVAVNLYRVEHSGSALIVAVEGIIFWILVWKRRAIGRKIARQDVHHWAYAYECGDLKHTLVYESLSVALGNILGRFALFTIVLGFILFSWGMTNPISLGNSLDTLLLLMLWSATVLPLGSIITYWGNRRGYPVMLIGIIAVLLFSYFNDNHRIRLLDKTGGGQAITERPTIFRAIDRWRSENCSVDGCKRFILVATAGGGIRAAYWTGIVLGRLHDKAPQGHFNRQLFALSGVSGGSVGATVYRAISAIDDNEAVTDNIKAVLGRDYLGPVSAGLLYPDAVQRLLPVAMLQDRAKVFEQSLEQGFSKALGNKVTGLDSSFVHSALFKEDRPWPALFLNSTWSDNGRRIVAATLQDAPGVLYKDLLQTLGQDMRLSTAAHNSARFPLVSPAGSWEPKDNNQNDVDLQRLQDGGLFENYGAETAIELLGIAKKNFADANMPFNPLVILITSDPKLSENLADFQYNKPIQFAAEVLSTPNTYANVRLGRGEEAASRLEKWAHNHMAETEETNFVSFRMCPGNSPLEEPPLGWALSKNAQENIEAYLNKPAQDCRKHSNEKSLEDVLSVFKLNP